MRDFASIAIIINLIMLVLGPVQLIWALIQGLVSKKQSVRNFFKKYWLGVGVYFLFVFIGSSRFEYVFQGPKHIYDLFYVLFYYFGAFGLAAFHVSIVIHSLMKKKQVNHESPDAILENEGSLSESEQIADPFVIPNPLAQKENKQLSGLREKPF